ncbi:helix-turn-helix domain-containing protein [Streptomyces sp. NPDC015237]|uniref:helix-turn-helix domain-containing protein n=1 Tax=unclassified Streptomyces TaxID=2593676 RepID=UPI0036FBB156
MGRPERPVDQTVPARAQLADFLRARRRAAGLTYRQMATLMAGQPSAATLERATSGTIVPSWPTVRHFVFATMVEDSLRTVMELNNSHELWVRARRATRAPYYVHKEPDPTLISDTAGFLRALRHQHVWSGYPTPGEMERMSGPGELPRTTTRRIIEGDALPVDPRQAIAFLRACYIREEAEIELWLAAAVRSLRNDSARSKNIDRWIKIHQEVSARVVDKRSSSEIIDLRKKIRQKAA